MEDRMRKRDIVSERDVVMMAADGDFDALPYREAVSTSSQPLLGELLIKENLITHAQLHEALRVQKELGDYKPIGQILVDFKAITTSQLNLILKTYRKRPLLGDILIKTGAVVNDQLEVALEKQKSTGLRLGETLIQLNYITEEQMRRALCLQYNIPFVDLNQFAPERSLARLINKNYAKRRLVVPMAHHNGVITLAMADPTDSHVIEELQSSTGFAINVVTSTYRSIQQAFARVYEENLFGDAELRNNRGLLTRDRLDELRTPGYLSEYVPDQTVDNLVRRLITLAINYRASDIHIESLGDGVRCRFRIDGVLQKINLRPIEDALDKNRRAVISRIKVLGKLDIAEKRRPQDGSFRARLEKEGQVVNIDFRISILPGYYGENVVLRILDPRNAPVSIDELGFAPAIMTKFHQLLRRTAGILLTTGPTGSGKSTTLYGALRTVYRPEIRILTAEDPIEYVYDQFSQCEVNEKIANTFARYLRAFLRHDPEVIMVGEIRDSETAEMAFRAAQTGHLVLSTLHTNDAVGTVIRLRDLGIDPSLITSSLLGVISQRLVREICSACKHTYQPSAELLAEFFDIPPLDFAWYRGKGCFLCNFTGYRGRMALAELWTPNQRDIILISKDAPIDEIRDSARATTLFMVDDIMQKLRDGRTNLEELIRAIPYSSLQQLRAQQFA
jgi:type IV pilus assembly protein PilB